MAIKNLCLTFHPGRSFTIKTSDGDAEVRYIRKVGSKQIRIMITADEKIKIIRNELKEGVEKQNAKTST